MCYAVRCQFFLICFDLIFETQQQQQQAAAEGFENSANSIRSKPKVRVRVTWAETVFELWRDRRSVLLLL